ncbi:glutamate--cysteine ligase regulatory subunit-like [Corticium candelabrum]|uniref:glutamate--cysteine ligase regulatory subunit-like n=1 Tax=Corticium candelabrum TaxID=121492 RepID=UPI002E26C69F|nr:glutamate--cysteine ligase regulatory subunit-like [Corticium candelabrum]
MASTSTLDDVRSLLINSGNIAKLNRFGSTSVLTPVDEVISGLSSAFQLWYSSEVSTCNKDHADCRHPSFADTIEASERDELVVTVKLFPSDFDPEKLEEAVTTALKELNVGHVDNIILSFPFHSKAGSSQESMKALWKRLENLQKRSLVTNLGVSDLDKPELEVLYQAAEVKPYLNQINMASCCVLPKDLVSYAKDKDIKLVITGDPRALVTQQTLGEILSIESVDSGCWNPLWTIRYRSVTKYTGVIRHHGYLVKCAREC